MSSSPLRVAFSDFFRLFVPEESMLFHALAARREVVVVDPSEADLLVFSVFGHRHRSFVGTKVHVTFENCRPPWPHADFFIGFDHLSDPRYLRVPYFAYRGFDDARDGFVVPPGLDWEEREFCNFIYSHKGTSTRRDLYRRLNAYRPVTSPGRFLNNASEPGLAVRYDPNWRRSKLLYQRRFRFTIACESASFPGYTTEKLYDALLAGTIPVYWGNPRVAEDIDERAYVNCHAFGNLDDVVERVREIDRDPELAASYLEHRIAAGTSAETHLERLTAFLDQAAALAERGADRPELRARARRLELRGAGRGTVRAAYRWYTSRQANPGDWRALVRRRRL